jgi:hypothetical protein
LYPSFTVEDGGFVRFAVTGAALHPVDYLLVRLMHIERYGRRVVADAPPEGISKTLEAFELPAGEYALEIIVADSTNQPALSVTQYVSTDPGDGPALTIDPPNVTVADGVPQDVLVNWRGLTPGRSYVGYVAFGSRDWRTLVSITVPPRQPLSITALTSVSGTATGSTDGGSTLAVIGTGFDAAATVTFGGVPARITARSSTRLSVQTPPHAAGSVDVTVNSAGQSVTVPAAFRYGEPPRITGTIPKWTLADIGGPLIIEGENLANNPEVTIRGERAAILQVSVLGTRIETAAPEGPAGLATISVTTDYGSDTFTLRYEGFPPS